MKKIISSSSDYLNNVRHFIRTMAVGSECSFDISKRRLVQNYTSDFKAIGKGEYRTSTIEESGNRRVLVKRIA